ncbi:transcriptional repressor LexA [Flagellimonas oceanensis]|uniref:transcriptional repressor LexA n=1 Tax=Flagellimonas oceanensis TaxID=2499163 RepID=UPI0013DFAAC5|nr:transcriptional repressor LexA [Allomuricauda oceanensis]
MLTKFSDKEILAIKVIREFLHDYGVMPSVRELMHELGYKSPRSAALTFKALEEKGILRKRGNGSYQLIEFEIPESFGTREQTVNIPLLGRVACGIPIFAQENIEAEIPISSKMIKNGQQYFILKAIGNSMDKKGIEDGDLVLIRQQQFAENGDLVVALINDEATIKEYSNKGNVVVLKPRSTNEKHQPIILTTDFRIQGVVEEIIKF